MPVEGILEFYETLNDVCRGRGLADEFPILVEVKGVKYKIEDILLEDDAIVIWVPKEEES